MIRSRDALLLARTKLRTRRIRLIVTVIVTSLLFSILAFLAILSSGVINSLNSFDKEGYGNRFFVQASPLTYQFGGPDDAEIIEKFKPVQTELIARKKDEAKRLGLTYDEKDDLMLPLQIAQNGPGTTDYYPNFSSPLITDFYKKKNASIPGTDFKSFTKLAKSQGATATYQGTQNGFDFFAGPNPASGQTKVLIAGKEAVPKTVNNQGNPYEQKGVGTITTLGWRSADKALLEPFKLPGQSLAVNQDGSIPIIAPLSAAEEILGLKSLPQTATSTQKLERLTKVRSEIAGKTAQLCYRNGTSVSLFQQAAEQQKEIEANKNKKDYIKPSLIYAIPESACGEVIVSTDKRTAEEKKLDSNQKTFDSTFNNLQPAEQGIATIRIVGISPDTSFGANISITAVLSSLLTSSAGGGWVSPIDSVAGDPLVAKMQGGTVDTVPRGRSLYYAEFSTVKSLEAFIKSQTCNSLMQVPGPDGSTMAVDPSGSGSATDKCISQAKVFSVQPYGNSAAAVEQFKEVIWKVARIAILVIVVIAALIMMGNIGKIIADSRRETSVFRALGAKRFDIAQIYLTYTVLVSLLIAIVSLFMGFILASIINQKVSPDLSVAAVLAYNAQDVSKQFLLFGFDPLYFAAIIALIIVAGVLSAILPLLANTRRNPIHDMRDDS